MELLQVFWRNHSPTRKAWSSQYQTVIFYHNDEQKEAAESSKLQLAKESGKTIHTKIRQLEKFYLAEDYHQKYYLRNSSRFMKQFSLNIPEENKFRNSTAAARVNGYLGRHGDYEQVKSEITSLGLSESLQKNLINMARKNSSAIEDQPW